MQKFDFVRLAPVLHIGDCLIDRQFTHFFLDARRISKAERIP
jgi:hypothetical protein